MQELVATTVVLADDHAIVREGIAALCTANGMRVLGQVSDGSAAIEMIAALNPDFAILDLHMPIVTGVEAIRRLRSAGSTVKLLILSIDRKSTRLNSSHLGISYAVFCLKKKTHKYARRSTLPACHPCRRSSRPHPSL